MMKGLMQSAIILLIVIFSLQTVSAITVTSMTIDPPGALAPGTPVTVQFEVDTPSYPSPGEVRFFTDLDNPTWTYTIIVNGIENIRPVMGGHTLVISGFELSYRADDVVSVQATLEGTTPTVSSLSDQVILQISDVNSHGNITTVYTNYYHQGAPRGKIAYTSDRNGNWEIFAMNPERDRSDLSYQQCGTRWIFILVLRWYEDCV